MSKYNVCYTLSANFAFSALTLMAGQQEGHLAHKNLCFKTDGC